MRWVLQMAMPREAGLAQAGGCKSTVAVVWKRRRPGVHTTRGGGGATGLLPVRRDECGRSSGAERPPDIGVGMSSASSNIRS